jgi:HEAT repeat protein
VLSTISDPSLRVAALAGAAAVALTLAIGILILGLRLHVRHDERRWQGFVAQWRPLLLGAMLAPLAPPLPALARRDHGRFLRLWTYLHESVRGEASERLNRAAVDLGIDRSARVFLRRGSRAQQLQAILAAGYLKDGSAWDGLLAMAGNSDGLVSVNAARALIRIDALRGAQLLMPLILARRDWEVTRVALFLADARDAFWLLLIKGLPTMQAGDLPRALALAEALRLQLPTATLRYLLDPGRPEAVLCSALRLAATPELAREVRASLAHEAPQVRLQAALATARQAGPADVPGLVALLDDGQWPVRLAAAQALASLPFLSNAQLAALQRAGGAANDVLRQVLAEREWA